jgi:hypothetical protein
MLRDLLERTFWTMIAAALGTIPAAQFSAAVFDLDVSALQTIGVAALTAASTALVNGLLVIARWRLSILPDPGNGLPGLPTYTVLTDDDEVLSEEEWDDDWDINHETTLDGGKGFSPADADPRA